MRPAVLALAFVLPLAACIDDAGRAARHFAAAQDLLAAGDEPRAMVELRNVLRRDGFHREARRSYAALLTERGELSEAQAQLLRLVEQYPEDAAARRHLALLMLGRGDAAGAEVQGRAAIRLAPADPLARGLAPLLDWRAARLAGNPAARAAAVVAARAVLDEPALAATRSTGPLPGAAALARRTLIAEHLLTGDTAAAVLMLGQAMQDDPDAARLARLRLGLLLRDGTARQGAAALADLAALAPDDAMLRGALVAWHRAQGDLPGAAAVLRAGATRPGATLDDAAALVTHLAVAGDGRAALAALDALAAQRPGDARALALMRAGLAADSGQAGAAAAALRTLIAEAPQADQTRLWVVLARLQTGAGQAVSAAASLARALEIAPADPAALRMRAATALQAGELEAAAADLRAAATARPDDPDTLSMLAELHLLQGDRSLAADRYVAAATASGQAPEHVLRAVALLRAEGRSGPAQAMLAAALRVHPADPGLLSATAALALQSADWPAVAALADRLAALPQTGATAADLRLCALLARGQVAPVLAHPSLAALAARVIEALLRSGDAAAAIALRDRLLAARPADAALLRLSARLDASTGDTATAEATLRRLLAADPADTAAARQFAGLLNGTGRPSAATDLLTALHRAAPRSVPLQRLLAEQRQRTGDIDGAIALFQSLQAANPRDPDLANNLASLLSTWRSDPASLARAAALAGPLRHADTPAHADTWGWIAYRRGDLADARAHLQRAAAGRPGDALVHYRLALVLADLGRTDAARASLARARSLGGATTLPLPLPAADAAGRPTAPAGPDHPPVRRAR